MLLYVQFGLMEYTVKSQYHREVSLLDRCPFHSNFINIGRIGRSFEKISPDMQEGVLSHTRLSLDYRFYYTCIWQHVTRGFVVVSIQGFSSICN